MASWSSGLVIRVRRLEAAATFRAETRAIVLVGLRRLVRTLRVLEIPVRTHSCAKPSALADENDSQRG